MTVRKLCLSAAVAAVSFGSAALAASGSSPAMLDTSGPTSLTPAMYLLDPTSFGKWMETNHLVITGFGEGGYFYDTSAPRMGDGPQGDGPTDVAFPGGFSNRGVLDQVDLTVEKTLDTSKQWDFGFLVENGYGVDDAQIHSFGVFDHRAASTAFNRGIDGSSTGAGNDPDNQYDIIQANVSLLVPVGSGLTFTGGKFVGLLSEELINPTQNAFYTHSYNFLFGVPVTNTGVTASYTFAKALNGNDLTVLAGVTRGWNETTRDNNGAIDFVAQAKAKINDKLSFVANLEEGPEGGDRDSAASAAATAAADDGTTHNVFESDNSDYWTTAEAILTYAYSDQLTVAGDFLYSDFPHGGMADSTPGVVDAGHSNAQWYGAALYGSYKINSNFTANLRAEWYRDQGGFTTGTQANYYEATAGVDIHPFPTDNILQFLQLRPELREDFSDRPVYNMNHDDSITPGDYTQFSVAMDVIMQF